MGAHRAPYGGIKDQDGWVKLVSNLARPFHDAGTEVGLHVCFARLLTGALVRGSRTYNSQTTALKKRKMRFEKERNVLTFPNSFFHIKIRHLVVKLRILTGAPVIRLPANELGTCAGQRLGGGRLEFAAMLWLRMQCIRSNQRTSRDMAPASMVQQTAASQPVFLRHCSVHQSHPPCHSQVLPFGDTIHRY